MRCIAVINQKGGVGKTTTAVQLSAGLARAGQRVLLADLDPQAHASLHVGAQLGADDPSIYDVLLNGTPLTDIRLDVNKHLSLLPASIALVGAELDLRERENRERILAAALAACGSEFDVCVIDCPPSLGLLTINALTAANEIIIPLQPHFLALQGMGRLLETVMLVRRALNPRLRVSGVVLCMYERGTRLAQEVLDDITRFLEGAAPTDAWHGARVFATRIRRNIKLAECPSFGQTIFDYAPDSHGAEDYESLSQEIIGAWSGAATTDAAMVPVSKPVAEVVPLVEPVSAAHAAAPLPPAQSVESP